MKKQKMEIHPVEGRTDIQVAMAVVLYEIDAGAEPGSDLSKAPAGFGENRADRWVLWYDAERADYPMHTTIAQLCRAYPSGRGGPLSFYSAPVPQKCAPDEKFGPYGRWILEIEASQKLTATAIIRQVNEFRAHRAFLAGVKELKLGICVKE